MLTWSAFAALTVLAGVGMGVLGAVAWYRHHGPGSVTFAVTMAGGAISGVAYGLNLFTFDVDASRLLEIPYWLGSEVIVVGVFLFALSFTGRARHVTRRNVVLVSLIPGLTVLIAVTNALGYHDWFWSNYGVVETFGAGVRTLGREPWLYTKTTYGTIIAGAAYLMFIEEVYVEKALFRTQSIALVVGGLIPLSGFLVWLLELGPYPHVDFMTPLYWTSVVAYGYAIYGAGLFESAPAVRRLGRQNTIDTLSEPVAILDADGIVTDLNAAATELLEQPRRRLLGADIADLLGEDALSLDVSTQSHEMRTSNGWREFEVRCQAIREQGELIGYTVLFYDVTAERRREQRLEVLNRILRHNLRNDITAIQAYLELVGDQVETEQSEEWVGRALESCKDLSGLAEKARRFERAIETADRGREEVSLAPLVADLAQQYRDAHPTATVRTNVPGGLTAAADETLLDLILSNLLENALEHGPSDEPVVEINGSIDGEMAVIEISDDGPGIPEIELEPLREGSEEPLQHGQGIGLWLVTWGVKRLGGTIEFETDEAGTTVRVALPTEHAVDEM